MSQRVGGIISLQVNGELYNAKGNFTYNLGRPLRESVLGSDRAHGFKETPQIAFVEGEITDRSSLDLATLVTLKDVTVTLELANGKVVVLRDSWYAADGTGNTDEGNIAVRFEGPEGEEVS